MKSRLMNMPLQDNGIVHMFIVRCPAFAKVPDCAAG